MHLTARPLSGRFVRLEPYSEDLKAEVRSALDQDAEAWSIMSVTAYGEGFETWWSDAMAGLASGKRIPFAVRRLSDGKIVGTTSFHDPRAGHRGVEIGYTFYAPEARSGPVNPEAKLLLLQEAFGEGALRVEFFVDSRNARSQAAVTKLGAVREGVLRAHKVTYTGHIRDTVVFSITAPEWPAVRERLEARLA
ncbi:GNAT family protein [Caulobacter sp. 17J65-9]|uniref:GNAT family N-acetyltransferase n=1 Tax=Caulobacter sp. 17J65-9 TaxID=2709382 RepID=UPI0013C70782|nr:GNAT family protein [Caulobacter sp. 17J65-9]NEX94870.1 GNAT family N-acetyltransferase [Caulobacter sp. 17J65-9]